MYVVYPSDRSMAGLGIGAGILFRTGFLHKGNFVSWGMVGLCALSDEVRRAKHVLNP